MDDYINLEDIGRDRRKAKVKGFFGKLGSGLKAAGRGAVTAGKVVGRGAKATASGLDKFANSSFAEKTIKASGYYNNLYKDPMMEKRYSSAGREYRKNPKKPRDFGF